MNKPTCTIQAWLCQSQTFFFVCECVFVPPNHIFVRHTETREKNIITTQQTIFVYTFFPWVKHDLAVSVGCRCVEFYFIWLFMTSACVQVAQETRFMGLLKFMTIAFMYGLYFVCVCGAFNWKERTNTTTRHIADLELFALELDRWYNDKKLRKPFENGCVWKCAMWNSPSNSRELQKKK